MTQSLKQLTLYVTLKNARQGRTIKTLSLKTEIQRMEPLSLEPFQSFCILLTLLACHTLVVWVPSCTTVPHVVSALENILRITLLLDKVVSTP